MEKLLCRSVLQRGLLDNFTAAQKKSHSIYGRKICLSTVLHPEFMILSCLLWFLSTTVSHGDSYSV